MRFWGFRGRCGGRWGRSTVEVEGGLEFDIEGLEVLYRYLCGLLYFSFCFGGGYVGFNGDFFYVEVFGRGVIRLLGDFFCIEGFFCIE